jgi:hypothetical protein
MKAKTMRRIFRREAVIMLILARLAVRFVSPARIFAWVNQPPRRVNRFAVDEAGWVTWAIEDIGARPWMNAQCLARALAAHAMLRRRGIVSRLCLGVAREGAELAAHAWVEVGESKGVGGVEAGGFARLAEFGGAC